MNKFFIAIFLLFSFLISNNAQTGWYLYQQLPPVEQYNNAGDQFGLAVDFHNYYLVVGMPYYNYGKGCAYVYRFDGSEWTKLAKLTASDADTNDYFGKSVAIYDKTIVIGAPNKNDGSGAVYVFSTSSEWTDMTETAKLTSSLDLTEAKFGCSVDIKGDTIVVGAEDLSTSDYTNVGRAFVYLKPAEGWKSQISETTILKPSTEHSFMNFGASVSILENILAIGATGFKVGSVSAGGVFVYILDQNSFQNSVLIQNSILTTSDPSESDHLGQYVDIAKALDTFYIYAGAPLKTIFILFSQISGAVYVYKIFDNRVIDTTEGAIISTYYSETTNYFPRGIKAYGRYFFALNLTSNAGVFVSTYFIPDTGLCGWIEENSYLKITESDDNNYAGQCIAFYDTMAIVGYPLNTNQAGYRAGQILVYNKTDIFNHPVDQHPFVNAAETIEPNDPYYHTSSNMMGSSVDIDGNYAVVGASKVNNYTGEVYVYKYEQNKWQRIATLKPTQPQAESKFGYSVAIDKDVIVVGAPEYDDSSYADVGRAFVFVKPSYGEWQDTVQTAILSPRQSQESMSFGYSVDIYDSTIVVGAPYEDISDFNVGAVYVFKEPRNGWRDTTPVGRLQQRLPQQDDYLGASVAVYGDVVIAGAPYDERTTYNEGLVYVFVKPSDGWKDTLNVAVLADSSGKSSANLGYDLALNDTAIFASAPNYRYLDKSSGVVLVFVRPGDSWSADTTIDTIVPYTILYPSDYDKSWLFGQAIDLSDSLLIVGDPSYKLNGVNYAGKAYIYNILYNMKTPRSEDYSVVPDKYSENDQFGVSVAIDSQFAFIGAPGVDTILEDNGKVFVFNYKTQLSVDIKDIEFQQKDFAYPVPAGDWLYLKGDYQGRLVIYDITGRKILSKKLRPEQPVNISSLSPGVYILRLRAEKGIYIQKIVKK